VTDCYKFDMQSGDTRNAKGKCGVAGAATQCACSQVLLGVSLCHLLSLLWFRFQLSFKKQPQEGPRGKGDSSC